MKRSAIIIFVLLQAAVAFLALNETASSYIYSFVMAPKYELHRLADAHIPRETRMQLSTLSPLLAFEYACQKRDSTGKEILLFSGDTASSGKSKEKIQCPASFGIEMAPGSEIYLGSPERENEFRGALLKGTVLFHASNRATVLRTKDGDVHISAAGTGALIGATMNGDMLILNIIKSASTVTLEMNAARPGDEVNVIVSTTKAMATVSGNNFSDAVPVKDGEALSFYFNGTVRNTSLETNFDEFKKLDELFQVDMSSAQKSMVHPPGQML